MRIKTHVRIEQFSAKAAYFWGAMSILFVFRGAVCSDLKRGLRQGGLLAIISGLFLLLSFLSFAGISSKNGN